MVEERFFLREDPEYIHDKKKWILLLLILAIQINRAILPFSTYQVSILSSYAMTKSNLDK